MRVLVLLPMLAFSGSVLCAPAAWHYDSGSREHPLWEGSRANIRVTSPAPNGLTIDSRATQAGRSSWLLVRVGSADAAPLAVGRYVGASATGGGGRPWLITSGCQPEAAEFEILDLARDNDGNIVRLALDYRTDCPLLGGAQHHGSVRLNSEVPARINPTRAQAGPDLLAPVGHSVELDGTRTLSGVPPPGSWRWTQVAGPEVTLQDAGSPIARFTASATPFPRQLGFELSVTAADGVVTRDTVNVFVVPEGTPVRRFEVQAVDADGTHRADAADDLTGFVAPPSWSPQFNRLELASGHAGDYLVRLTFPTGNTLAPGRHVGARAANSDYDGTYPGLFFVGPDIGCSWPTGEFTVRVAELDGTQVTRLWVEVEMACPDGSSATYAYRWMVPR